MPLAVRSAPNRVSSSLEAGPNPKRKILRSPVSQGSADHEPPEMVHVDLDALSLFWTVSVGVSYRGPEQLVILFRTAPSEIYTTLHRKKFFEV